MKKLIIFTLFIGLLGACSSSNNTTSNSTYPRYNIPRSVDKIIKGLEGCKKEFVFEVMGLPDDEKIIDEKIYASLMEFKVPNSKIISKNRYYFSYEGKYMYLDVFDGNKEFGILEVNVSEDENIVIPENICVLDNVSSNKSYENRNISRLEKGRCLRK